MSAPEALLLALGHPNKPWARRWLRNRTSHAVLNAHATAKREAKREKQRTAKFVKGALSTVRP